MLRVESQARTNSMVERLQNQVEKEERDLTILREVIADGPIGIVKLANRTELPEHKVRYSLRMLENDEFIEPTPNGAIPADDIDEQVARINDGLTELIDRLERVRDAKAPSVDAERYPGSRLGMWRDRDEAGTYRVASANVA